MVLLGLKHASILQLNTSSELPLFDFNFIGKGICQFPTESDRKKTVPCSNGGCIIEISIASRRECLSNTALPLGNIQCSIKCKNEKEHITLHKNHIVNGCLFCQVMKNFSQLLHCFLKIWKPTWLALQLSQGFSSFFARILNRRHNN